MLIFLAGATVFSMSVTGGLNRTPARCKRYDTEISGNRGRRKTRHPGTDCRCSVLATMGTNGPVWCVNLSAGQVPTDTANGNGLGHFGQASEPS